MSLGSLLGVISPLVSHSLSVLGPAPIYRFPHNRSSCGKKTIADNDKKTRASVIESCAFLIVSLPRSHHFLLNHGGTARNFETQLSAHGDGEASGDHSAKIHLDEHEAGRFDQTRATANKRASRCADRRTQAPPPFAIMPPLICLRFIMRVDGARLRHSSLSPGRRQWASVKRVTTRRGHKVGGGEIKSWAHCAPARYASSFLALTCRLRRTLMIAAPMRQHVPATSCK